MWHSLVPVEVNVETEKEPKEKSSFKCSIIVDKGCVVSYYNGYGGRGLFWREQTSICRSKNGEIWIMKHRREWKDWKVWIDFTVIKKVGNEIKRESWSTPLVFEEVLVNTDIGSPVLIANEQGHIYVCMLAVMAKPSSIKSDSEQLGVAVFKVDKTDKSLKLVTFCEGAWGDFAVVVRSNTVHLFDTSSSRARIRYYRLPLGISSEPPFTKDIVRASGGRKICTLQVVPADSGSIHLVFSEAVVLDPEKEDFPFRNIRVHYMRFNTSLAQIAEHIMLSGETGSQFLYLTPRLLAVSPNGKYIAMLVDAVLKKWVGYFLIVKYKDRWYRLSLDSCLRAPALMFPDDDTLWFAVNKIPADGWVGWDEWLKIPWYSTFYTFNLKDHFPPDSK